VKGSVLGRRFEYTVPLPKTLQEYRSKHTEYADLFREMSNWCSDQKFDHWGTEGNTFWFCYEKDYLMFLLRWS